MRICCSGLVKTLCLTTAAFILTCETSIYARKVFKAIRSSEQRQVIKVVPSQLLDILSEEAKNHPNITAEEAARYANTLLPRHGFNYEFEACPIIKANRRPRNVPDPDRLAKAYGFPMMQADGQKIYFQFISDQTEALCGRCGFLIPALYVNKQEILLVSKEKQYSLKRPPGFIVKEMDLVDDSLKRVIRTWQVPLDSTPAGVSEDGTKLYLDLYGDPDDLLGKLVLEISGTNIRFKARDEVGTQKGEEIKKHPTDPRYAYLSFKRFHVGNRSYIIRYDAPCT